MSDPHTEHQSSPSKPFDVYDFVLRYWKRVLALGTILLLIAGPLVYFFVYTSYSATGIIRVAPTMPSLLASDRQENLGNQYRSFVKTQVLRLRHYETLMAALNRLPPGIKAEFIRKNESLLDAAQRLQKDLQVAEVPNSHLISLSLKGNQPTGLAEVINSIVNVYLEKVAEEEAGLDNRRLAFLKQEQKQVEAQITSTRQKVNSTSATLGVQSFSASDDIYRNKRAQIQEAYLLAQNEALKRRIALEKTKELEFGIADTQNPDYAIQQQLTSHPLYVQTREYTYSKIRSLRTQLTGMAESNPERAVIEERIEQLTAELNDVEQEVRGELVTSIEQQNALIKAQRVEEAEANFFVAQSLEEELRKEFQNVDQEVNERARLIQNGYAVLD